MAFALKDIGALGRPLTVLAVVLAACAAGIAYSGTLVKRARTEVAAAQKQLNEARDRVQKSGTERDMIAAYVGPYTALVERGVVGEEQRLAWVDALREASNQARLYGVDYEVSARQPYAYAAEVEAGGLPVQQSVMKLSFGILYEDDLLAFFRALREQNVGTFTLQQCVLERVSRDLKRPVNAPALRAQCELAWITIPAQISEGS
jgi:hypothetical protein